ncbi:MAG: hypothetical protein N2557_04790 [Hydrogenophilus sp.]|nr:hypothetical protein [Hydrogenophilus sp.]
MDLRCWPLWETFSVPPLSSPPIQNLLKYGHLAGDEVSVTVSAPLHYGACSTDHLSVET